MTAATYPDIWEYPPIPAHTGRFYGVNGRHYGYAPAEIIKWDWSVTFGRWGAYVMQSDGSTIYTYPELL